LSAQRKPPWSPEAEKGVLAGVLDQPEIAIEVFAILGEEDFFDPRHRLIYRTARSLDGKGMPIDLYTVISELGRTDDLTQAGDTQYIAGLADEVPYLTNALSYCQIVRDCSLLRQFLAVAGNGMEKVYSTNVSAVELLDEISQKIFDIGTTSSQRDFFKVSELTAETVRMIESLRDSAGGLTGLSTGIDPLDRLTTGFHGGEMNVLAARPGVGKTSLALNIADCIAKQRKGAVAFFSLEMTAAQLTQRLVCSKAGVGLQAIIDGTIAPRHYEDLRKAARELEDLPLYINDSSGISSAEIRAKTRRLAQKEKGVAAVFVDYLQLMQGADDVENHQLRVARNSSDLKGLAKDLDIPVIVLSQLSRGAARREGPPKLSDLRDSGAIEQDADLVMFLHDENADSGDADLGNGGLRTVLLKIAKQRKGRRGQFNLMFDTVVTRFFPDERDDPGF
jgi:replicative DNA helicase